jgi:hypothetical protein
MKVKIAKDWRKHISPVTKERLDCAIRFGIEHFELDRYDRTIYVVFTDHIDNDGTVGLHHYYPRKTYNVIEILAKNRFWLEMASTIFHEMTHVKQTITKELVFHTDSTLWQNQIVPKDTGYWDLPYEVDARVQQRALTRKWLWYRFKMWLTKGKRYGT